MEGVAVDRFDNVSGAQASLFRGSSRRHILNADGPGHNLRLQTRIVQVEVVLFSFRGYIQREINGRTAAFDGDRYGLVGIQLGAFVDLFPIGIVGIVKMADVVASL